MRRSRSALPGTGSLEPGADDQDWSCWVWLFQRTGRPARSEALAMWDARAAWWPIRMFEFGDLRLRMQSSQFCKCVSVPSPLDRTKMSGSGVLVPAAYAASSL